MLEQTLGSRAGSIAALASGSRLESPAPVSKTSLDAAASVDGKSDHYPGEPGQHVNFLA